MTNAETTLPAVTFGQWQRWQLSRRRFLQATATVAALTIYTPTRRILAADEPEATTLRLTSDALGDSLEPGRWNGMGIARVLDYVGAHLTRPNRSGQRTDPPEGGAAEKWAISADGLTYTFTLRRGLTFHDGTAVDAAAVVRSLTRQMNPSDPSYVAGCDMHINYTLNRRSISAPDPATVVIALERPDPAYLYRLFHPSALILSPTALDRCTAGIHHDLISCGPYQIERFAPNREVVLTAFAGFWASRPAVERIIIQTQPTHDL